MKNTRDKVLEALANLQTASVHELTDFVSVNPITIRHHLKNLEAEKLITRSEQRHGVGRPRMIYRLSTQGAKRFPLNFKRLTENLLSSIKTLYGTEASIEALNMIGKNMASSYDQKIPDGNIQDIMAEFSRLLRREGYQIEWELQDNLLTVYNKSCPYHHLSKSHPEICYLDQSFFSEILGKDVKLQKHKTGKNNKCTFVFEV